MAAAYQERPAAKRKGLPGEPGSPGDHAEYSGSVEEGTAGRGRRRTGLDAGLEAGAAGGEARFRCVTRVVAALEGDHLHLLDAHRVALAGSLGGLERGLALRDGGVQRRLHRIVACRAVGPAGLDAGVILVAAGVLGGGEVLEAGAPAGRVGALGIDATLLRIVDGPASRRADPDAALEAAPAGPQRRLVGLPDALAAHERVGQRIVDALLERVAVRGKRLLAVADRDPRRGVARPGGVREPGGGDAVRAHLAAGIHAVVILVDACVLCRLVVVFAAGLAVLEVSRGRLDALADLTGPRVHRQCADEYPRQRQANHRTIHVSSPSSGGWCSVDDRPLG